MATEVNLGQSAGGTVQDADTAPEAAVIADLVGGVPPTESVTQTDPLADPEPPHQQDEDGPDPDPKPLFGDVSEAKSEPKTEETEAEEIVADAGFSGKDLAELKTFVDKNYGGSTSDFIKGWYETRTSNATLSRDLGTLKEQFQAFVDGFNE